ncbi:MAG: ATP-grasp domain-containing protein [Bacteroidales bacterium]|nr:ATP-grasp domain-containing protein [Bacteroidales bacterium]
MKRKVVIVTNKLSEGAGADELDVLEQADMVANACEKLGYEVARMEMGLDLQSAISRIREEHPEMLFNLVESLDNKGEFAFIAASVFSSLGIPYSGTPVIPMFLASNKVLAKRELVRLGLPTPKWFGADEAALLDPRKRYILKPIWEEGSLDLDESSVFYGTDERMKETAASKSREHYFIEEYIEGREFNISILGGLDGPEVLPLAEMQFLDFPAGKPKILGYRSKWEEESFEYTHTTRTFQSGEQDRVLHLRLIELCEACWKGFGLKGYVRIDFRVTKEGEPLIIDINANPCLSHSGGFAAALEQAGYSFTEAIRRILADAVGSGQWAVGSRQLAVGSRQ